MWDGRLLGAAREGTFELFVGGEGRGAGVEVEVLLLLLGFVGEVGEGFLAVCGVLDGGVGLGELLLLAGGSVVEVDVDGK